MWQNVFLVAQKAKLMPITIKALTIESFISGTYETEYSVSVLDFRIFNHSCSQQNRHIVKYGVDWIGLDL